jgi:hypothetical protein
MLATQKNHLIAEGKIEANALIQLDKFICNEVEKKDETTQKVSKMKIIIILDVSPQGTQPLIGVFPRF